MNWRLTCALPVFAGLLATAGCGSSSSGIGVSILPSAQQRCDAGQTINYTATVSHDASGAGVTWSLSGAGSLASATSTSVVFTAPSTAITALPASITATSKSNGTVAASATILIQPSPSIATATLPNALAGTAYTQTLTELGGIAPYTWSISSGSLPTGLALNSATGVISGTPTGSNGTSSFTVKLTDSAAPSESATFNLSITVGPTTLAISTTVIAPADYGVSYSAALTATGGTPPYAWSIASGNLPTGLTLSSAGVLSGTPTASGTFPFTVQVADAGAPTQKATQQLTLTVSAQIVVTSTTLPNGKINTAYSAQLSATGGTGSISWSVATGSTLPAGLTLSSTGLLSGTPTASGTSTFSVQAADSNTPPQTATQALTLLIVPANVTITTTTLPNAAAGSTYSTTLQSIGGTPPITWSISLGSLPAGLGLNAATGVISGIATAQGTFNFTVQAKDSGTPQTNGTQALTLVVTPPAPLAITTTTLPNATATIGYSVTIATTGGIAPLMWSVTSGSLPTGLTLGATTGTIAGTTTATGIFTFTVTVTDSETPPVSVSKQFSLSVYPALPTGTNNAELSGSYAFLFSAFTNGSATGSVYGAASIGQLALDGKGDVTGTEDINSASGVQTQVSFTGTYAVGADNRGILVLNNGTTLTTMAISVGNIVSGLAQKIHMIEFDDTSTTSTVTAVGTGVAKLQTTSAFASSVLKGGFVFGLQGQTPCTTCATPATPFGPVAVVAQITGDGNGNITSGQEDAAAANTNYSGVTLTGTYTTPSATTGRATMKLSTAGALYPGAPSDYIVYVVGPSELLVLSSDSHASYTLLSGDMQLQQQVLYTSSSPTGEIVGYESSAQGGNGLTTFPASSVATLDLLTITTAGAGTLAQDINASGAASSTSGVAVTYTVSATGRMPLTVNGTAGPVLYLYNNAQAFGLDEPTTSGSAPGLIAFEPEVVTNGLPPLLSGAYAASTQPMPVPATMQNGETTFTLSSGGVNAFYSGTFSSKIDSSSPAGTLTSAAASTGIYLEATNGRTIVANTGSSTTVAVIYIISATKAVEISVGAGTTPTVSVLEQ